jgi:hypothetical protein
MKSRRMRWAGLVASMGEKFNAYRSLLGNPQGKTQLGRPRLRWVANIEMELLEMNWCCMVWTGLIWMMIKTLL